MKIYRTQFALTLIVAGWMLTLAADLHAANRARADPAAAREYFTDIPLTDQDGQPRRLYSDLLRDRVVVISAMFTDCQGVCPVTMGNLAKLQRWLGPRLGKDVYLLSLTVDRENDSPARLKAYAERFNARPGWYFLTGPPENLDAVLRKLGLHTRARESHSPIFLVGNVATGLWKKTPGMAPAAGLIDVVDSVLADRMETEGAASR
ncbi:MAG: SCO family protein [Acidobacteriota bacterium]